MDRNKLAELRKVSYRIAPTCGLCKHGVFPNNDWGTCAAQTYEHAKHSDTKRHLSIYKGGSCGKFELDENVPLGAYTEFL